jgi:hypothetical protein
MVATKSRPVTTRSIIFVVSIFLAEDALKSFVGRKTCSGSQEAVPPCVWLWFVGAELFVLPGLW